MLDREFKKRAGLAGSRIRAIGTALGMGLLFSSTGAIAAPVFPVAQNAGTPDRTNPGDVVIDAEPQQPDNSGSSTGGTPSSTLANTRFSCQTVNGEYTVMYNPESQPGKYYAWAKPGLMGGGWTPDRRCNEISRRLESYRPDGLVEMRTGIENGYNVVCVTTQKVSDCRIVMTVPQGQDPTATRNRVFENLTIADNGQQTQAVNTFVAGRRSGNDLLNQVGGALEGLSQLGRNRNTVSGGINLRPFLDRADGGTGERLKSGAVSRPGLRLNPNRFR